MDAPAPPSPGAAAPRLPADAGIGRVRLRVADLERALAFYRGLLGLRVVDEAGAAVTLAPGGDAAEGRPLVVLREVPGLARRPARPATTGLYHAALLVPTRRDLGRALLALHGAGYPLRGMADHAVSESIYLDDPDGNGLELYADRPRFAWAFAGGLVRMTTDPMDVDGVVAAAGERPAPWQGLPPETVVGHVHFTVSDLARAEAFYRGVLGFDVTFRVPTLVGVAAGGYHHHVNLNTWAGRGAPPDADGVAGLDAWELVVPGAGARQALAERLGAEAPSPDGRVAARDPDGIRVEVVGGG